MSKDVPNHTSKDPEYEWYLSERNRLIASLNSQYDSYDKNMLLLSGGAFGITFTFIEKFVSGPIQCRVLLLLAWAMFLLSILTTLISFLISQKSHELDIDELDARYGESNFRKGNGFTSAVGVCNIVSMLLFVFALSLIIIFVALNFVEVI